MTTANERIRERVDAFMSELDELIHEGVLQQVHAALADSVPAGRVGAKATSSPSSARASKRATAQASKVDTNSEGEHALRAPQRPRTTRRAAHPAKLEPRDAILRILSETGRPMARRTLALASTLAQDIANDIVERLVSEGRVTIKHDEVVLAPGSSEPRGGQGDPPAQATVHQFVVRRNGERVGRLKRD